MYAEKDHLCTGNNCVLCRIFAAGQPGRTSNSVSVDDKSLLKLQTMPQPSGASSISQNTESVDRLEMIERLAFFDQLTGIYNAHAFMRELQEEVTRSQRYKRPLSICMVVINGFAEIKSNYGPLGSEMALKHIAALLKETLRGIDMAARYQDEQFALILPETNNAGAIVVAERLIKRIASRPVKLNWQSINITASVGVATFLKHGQTRDDMIRAALSAIMNKTG